MAKQSFTTGQVLTAAQVNSLQANDFNQTVSAKTASYVLVASDKGTRIEFNTSGSVTCTVNTGLFDAGDTVYIQNRGAGVVTITAGTATVNTSASLAVNQWEGGLLYFISASAAVWYEYASTANGDITGVTAGTGISGGGTSGDVTITNSMATAIDAKGDLIAGTADNTFSRLAAGSNGETLVADSSASTGLRWQGTYAAGKNLVINGGFDIWQRGTSFTTTTYGLYSADRWLQGTDGSGVTKTVSQQTFTPGSAPVAGYEAQYFHRINQSVAGTGAGFNVLDQRIEDVRIGAGQTMTLSFWAKTASAKNINIQYIQSFGTGGSGDVVTAVVSGQTIGTSWTRYTFTTAIPSISGKTIGTNSFLLLRFLLPLNDTFTFDLWGVQLEVGSVATAFTRAGGTLAGELAACQRYYYRFGGQGAYQRFNGAGSAGSATVAVLTLYAPVTMRANPTSLDYANLTLHDNSNTFAVTSASINAAAPLNTAVNFNVASGLTTNRFYEVIANNSLSAYLGLSAEL